MQVSHQTGPSFNWEDISHFQQPSDFSNCGGFDNNMHSNAFSMKESNIMNNNEVDIDGIHSNLSSKTLRLHHNNSNNEQETTTSLLSSTEELPRFPSPSLSQFTQTQQQKQQPNGSNNAKHNNHNQARQQQQQPHSQIAQHCPPVPAVSHGEFLSKSNSNNNNNNFNNSFTLNSFIPHSNSSVGITSNNDHNNIVFDNIKTENSESTHHQQDNNNTSRSKNNATTVTNNGGGMPPLPSLIIQNHHTNAPYDPNNFVMTGRKNQHGSSESGGSPASLTAQTSGSSTPATTRSTTATATAVTKRRCLGLSVDIRPVDPPVKWRETSANRNHIEDAHIHAPVIAAAPSQLSWTRVEQVWGSYDHAPPSSAISLGPLHEFWHDIGGHGDDDLHAYSHFAGY